LPATANPASPAASNSESLETAATIAAISILPHSTLAVLPTPRTLAPIKATASTSFSYLGLTLKAPWVNVSSTIEKSALLQVQFTNGKAFTLFYEGKGGFAPTSTMTTITTESSTIRTGYDLYNATLHATPDQITPGTPGDQAHLIGQLLILKNSIVLSPTWNYYGFDTGIIKGFESVLSTTKPTIDVHFFDKQDNYYDLFVSGTLDETDYILNSIQIQK
jgi:hypothetical protein